MTYDENHYPRNKKSMNIFSSELQRRKRILLPMTPRQSTTQVQARQSINVRGTFMCADRIEERVDVRYLRLDSNSSQKTKNDCGVKFSISVILTRMVVHFPFMVRYGCILLKHLKIDFLSVRYYYYNNIR